MALTKVDPSVVNDQVIGRRNLIINGEMRIAQRGPSSSGQTGAGYFCCDRFDTTMSSAGTWTVSQDSTVPTGAGFVNSMKYQCTTADSSLDASNYLIHRTSLEGQDLQHLKYGTSSAEKLTLSFWVRSAKTGTYIVEFVNHNSGVKSNSQSYTISSADTWEKKTITIDGDTATGFLNNIVGQLSLYFWLASGSTYTGGTLSTSWTSMTNANRAVGQVNLADSTSNNWYITGVQLEVGDAATPFEHRDPREELKLCRRYYQELSGFHALPMWSYGRDNASCIIWLDGDMRTDPTASYSGDLGTLQTATQMGVYENGWITTNSMNLVTGTSASNPRMVRMNTAHATNAFADTGAACGFYCNDEFKLIFQCELN